MKALVILKDIYDVNSGKKSKLVMTFSERMKFVKEAIEELEVLQNRKCSNCLSKRYCDVVTQNEDSFYCSEWELK